MGSLAWLKFVFPRHGGMGPPAKRSRVAPAPVVRRTHLKMKDTDPPLVKVGKLILQKLSDEQYVKLQSEASNIQVASLCSGSELQELLI